MPNVVAAACVVAATGFGLYRTMRGKRKMDGPGYYALGWRGQKLVAVQGPFEKRYESQVAASGIEANDQGVETEVKKLRERPRLGTTYNRPEPPCSTPRPSRTPQSSRTRQALQTAPVCPKRPKPCRGDRWG